MGETPTRNATKMKDGAGGNAETPNSSKSPKLNKDENSGDKGDSTSTSSTEKAEAPDSSTSDSETPTKSKSAEKKKKDETNAAPDSTSEQPGDPEKKVDVETTTSTNNAQDASSKKPPEEATSMPNPSNVPPGGYQPMHPGGMMYPYPPAFGMPWMMPYGPPHPMMSMMAPSMIAYNPYPMSGPMHNVEKNTSKDSKPTGGAAAAVPTPAGPPTMMFPPPHPMWHPWGIMSQPMIAPTNQQQHPLKAASFGLSQQEQQQEQQPLRIKNERKLWRANRTLTPSQIGNMKNSVERRMKRRVEEYRKASKGNAVDMMRLSRLCQELVSEMAQLFSVWGGDERLREDGFLHVKRVLPPGLVELLRIEAHQAIREEQQHSHGKWVENHVSFGQVVELELSGDRIGQVGYDPQKLPFHNLLVGGWFKEVWDKQVYTRYMYAKTNSDLLRNTTDPDSEPHWDYPVARMTELRSTLQREEQPIFVIIPLEDSYRYVTGCRYPRPPGRPKEFVHTIQCCDILVCDWSVSHCPRPSLNQTSEPGTTNMSKTGNSADRSEPICLIAAIAPSSEYLQKEETPFQKTPKQVDKRELSSPDNASSELDKNAKKMKASDDC